jgi:hypothetical protein
MKRKLSQQYFRFFLLGVFIVHAVNHLFSQSLHRQSQPQSRELASASASQDFDFLIGNWVVKHRKLKHRLANRDDWETFSGTCAMKTLLDGSANVDDNLLETPEGAYRAASLRAFDSATRKWSIWWLDSRHPSHLDVPVLGEFRNGVGTFFADDTWDGQPIRVRFIWFDITPNSARWQQAFSVDNGRTWETNWIMEFKRVPPPRP